jgi:hypothetical protein
MISVIKPMSRSCENECPKSAIHDVKSDVLPPQKCVSTRQKVSFKDIFARLKRIKHIEVYAAVAIIAIMVLIFFSNLNTGTHKQNSTPAIVNNETMGGDLENRIKFILQNTDGVGLVDVMMTDTGIVILATNANDPRVQDIIFSTIQTLIPEKKLNIKISPRK